MGSSEMYEEFVREGAQSFKTIFSFASEPTRPEYEIKNETNGTCERNLPQTHYPAKSARGGV